MCFLQVVYVAIFMGGSQYRGGPRISGKGAHMCKDVGVRFADFTCISFFFYIP